MREEDMRKNNRKFRKKLHLSVAADGREPRSFDSLPADIVGIILSFLPGKEAAVMATLSKTCHFALPVLNFDDCINYSPLSQKERSVIFNKMVDDTLSKFHPCDSSHKTIRFRTRNAFILKRMDQWLELARIKEFTDLYLDLTQATEYYPLPRTLYAFKSLTVLHIGGCQLPRGILHKSTRLDTLQEVHLTGVSSAERLIDRLGHVCPSIMNLSLIRCTMYNLILSRLDKLTKVNVKDCGLISNIVIKAQSLRIFKYNQCNGYNKRVCNINVSRCRNLKVLNLDSSARIEGLSPDICSMFPLLEELFLGFCGCSLPLNIASPVLQILVLSNRDLVVNAAIDTPNLKYFECTQLSLFRAMTWTPKEIRISLLYYHLVGASWLLRLRTFLEKSPSNCKKLSIELAHAMVKFEHEDVTDYISSVSPGINVLNLEIGTIINGNYIELIDGLLWSCHPETLSIQFSDAHINKEAMEAFCYEMCNRETKPSCCGTTRRKCWLHHIRHIDMAQLGDSCRNILEHRQKLIFNMKWVKGKKKN